MTKGKTGFFAVLYALVLPTVLSMAVFSYYPKIDVVIKAFFRWEPPNVEEFIGLSNFARALADPLFWSSFQLVGILLATNILKLIPGIIAAIVLHRIASDRERYWWQVGFVVPMIIPGIVWMLVWKGIYDPDFGMFNSFLNATGLMKVLVLLDGSHLDPGLMPQVAALLQPLKGGIVNPLFGSVWGLILFGVFVYFFRFVDHESHPRERPGHFPSMKALGSHWIIASFILLAGMIVWFGGLFQMVIWLAVALIVRWVVVRLFFDPCKISLFMSLAAWSAIGFGLVILLLGSIWTEPTGQFIEGRPAWLGHKDLVIPALIFWGFPWVHSVGVLIYLAGLQQIPKDVYEAAELDGLGFWGKIFSIELPLIMTQVRINLILLTIGTLTAYEQFLILLGPDGGPENRGMVPGLYMFKKAFHDGSFGYACALGMVLFVIIMVLTIIYNKYVKVEK